MKNQNIINPDLEEALQEAGRLRAKLSDKIQELKELPWAWFDAKEKATRIDQELNLLKTENAKLRERVGDYDAILSDKNIVIEELNKANAHNIKLVNERTKQDIKIKRLKSQLQAQLEANDSLRENQPATLTANRA